MLSNCSSIWPVHSHGQAAQHHILVPGKLGNQCGVDAQHDGRAGGEDGALGGRHWPADELHQRALSGAVAADHAYRFAPFNHEGNLC